MTVDEAVREVSLFHINPLSVISDCLRGFIIAAPGHELVCCDFNSVESRVVNWLAHEEKVLDIFRGDGKIYEHTASQIFRTPIEEVTKEQRQIGKVAELALGFGGGKGAFLAMAKNYGVKVSEEKAEHIKFDFRASRPKLVQYWYDVERAAIGAVLEKRKWVVGFESRISFKRSGSFLFCQLPSKRVLCYPYPKIQAIMMPWGVMKDTLTFMGENSLSHKWERQTSYGAKLVENITQAVARDLLVAAFFRLEKAGYPIVMHVHDEIVCEVPIKAVAEVPENIGSTEEMEKIMAEVPAWAAGLPIQAVGWRGKRYKKG